MLLLALLIAGLAGQETHASSARASDLYQRPAIAPTSPIPISAGRSPRATPKRPRGRRPIRGPVSVEAYRSSYERRRSQREIGYDQGVGPEAEARAQALMGPLDGVWRRRSRGAPGARARPVGSRRRASSRCDPPVWNRPAKRHPAAGRCSRVGKQPNFGPTSTGRSVTLRLQPSETGLTGVLSGLGPDRPVTLTRKLQRASVDRDDLDRLAGDDGLVADALADQGAGQGRDVADRARRRDRPRPRRRCARSGCGRPRARW